MNEITVKDVVKWLNTHKNKVAHNIHDPKIFLQHAIYAVKEEAIILCFDDKEHENSSNS